MRRLRSILIAWGVALVAAHATPAAAELPMPSASGLVFASDRIDLAFDLPAVLPCRELPAGAAAGERLIEVVAPVSLVLYAGATDDLQDVVVEIDGGPSGLAVHDYSPRTALTTALAEPIEQKRSVAVDKSLGGSLGGKLGADVAITPTLSGGLSKTETASETISRLPPKTATIVSGTTGGRTGVFFKLRRSSQSTLEGEHTFRVVFSAPSDWEGGEVLVRCVAHGRKDWRFVKKRAVWSESEQPVELRLVSHTVAKPPVDDCAD